MAWLTKRGSFYYIKFSVGGRKRRVSTGTGVFQIAKEKLRRFEDAQARGGDARTSGASAIEFSARAQARARANVVQFFGQPPSCTAKHQQPARGARCLPAGRPLHWLHASRSAPRPPRGAA